jgi:hypothetical protein
VKTGAFLIFMVGICILSSIVFLISKYYIAVKNSFFLMKKRMIISCAINQIY